MRKSSKMYHLFPRKYFQKFSWKRYILPVLILIFACIVAAEIFLYIVINSKNDNLNDDLTEKYTVPSVDEVLWNEKHDENDETVRFTMEFKDLKSPRVNFRFIIGATWNETIRKSNEKESQKFGDLIITDIRDTYLNGTLKAYALLIWQQQYCPQVKYLLKTDDDVVVNIPRLQYWIKKDFNFISRQNNNNAIFCKVLTKGTPLRNPNKKWFISKQMYNKSVFPDYCSGATYLMTSKAVKSLIYEAPNQNFNHIEDVFFPGIVAEEAGVKLIDKWKNFGYGNEINSKFGCDENGVPFLTTIYENGNDDVIYEENKSNKFEIATRKLSSLSCKWWPSINPF